MRKAITAVLFALIFSAIVPSAPVLALEIIYPGNHTSVDRSDYLIIKGGEKPLLDAMTVSINGSKSGMIDISGADYRAAYKDFLFLQPTFDPGRNKVVVNGYVGGKKVATATAEIYYQADPASWVPKGFPRFVMHVPQREALCAPCHNMNPTAAQLAADTADKNPCASCHRRMLDKSHVHGPAGVYRCTYCHQTSGTPSRYQTRPGNAKLCNECHQDKVQEFRSRKFVHGPVAAGLCTVCHDPHASNNPAQLVLPINTLCLKCHAAIATGIHVVRGPDGKGHPLKGVPDPMDKSRQLSCASCHDPHGGNSPYYFQRGISSRFELCQMCHRK